MVYVVFPSVYVFDYCAHICFLDDFAADEANHTTHSAKVACSKLFYLST